MSKLVECRLLCVNNTTDEDLWIPGTIRLDCVMAIKRDLDQDGIPKPHTVVYLVAGDYWIIDIPYDDFLTRWKAFNLTVSYYPGE